MTVILCAFCLMKNNVTVRAVLPSQSANKIKHFVSVGYSLNSEILNVIFLTKSAEGFKCPDYGNITRRGSNTDNVIPVIFPLDKKSYSVNFSAEVTVYCYYVCFCIFCYCVPFFNLHCILPSSLKLL